MISKAITMQAYSFRSLIKVFFIISLMALVLSSCKKETAKTTTLTGKSGHFTNVSLEVNKETRVFDLVVSSKLDLNTSNKLIIAFHGLGIDSKDLMPTYSNLSNMAESMNAIIVYPNAQNGTWGLNPNQTKNDIEFFDLLLNKIKESYLIDLKNIHIVGMSNGAYFCHLLAKNRSELIASVAAHSGMVGQEFILGINAKRKYPVLMIHGENDPIFSITTAEKDLKKYLDEGHKAHLIKVKNLGHEWASAITINDSISQFFKSNPL